MKGDNGLNSNNDNNYNNNNSDNNNNNSCFFLNALCSRYGAEDLFMELMSVVLSSLRKGCKFGFLTPSPIAYSIPDQEVPLRDLCAS